MPSTFGTISKLSETARCLVIRQIAVAVCTAIALLGVDSEAKAQQRTKRFTNHTSHPVYLTLGLFKDDSIAGIGGRGWSDPDCRMLILGTYYIPSKMSRDLPLQIEKKLEGKKMTFQLRYIRVATKAENRQQEMMPNDPNKRQHPTILPVARDLGGHFDFTLKWINQQDMLNRIRASNNTRIHGRPFYHLGAFTVKTADNKFHYAVGKP